MNARILALAFFGSASLMASAQELDDIEPGVDTRIVEAEADIEPAADASPADEFEPAVDTAAATASPAPRTVDSIELDAAQITGNQELPQVLYIVPWKASDLGDLVGRPVNTLLDEVLAPADRDVFRRQMAYYEDLHAVEDES